MASVPATPVPPPTAGSLAAVPRLLRSDPALAVLVGAADATVAVPQAAQAVVAAALAAFTERTPLLVAKVPKAALGALISCSLAYTILGLGLGIAAYRASATDVRVHCRNETDLEDPPEPLEDLYCLIEGTTKFHWPSRFST